MMYLTSEGSGGNQFFQFTRAAIFVDILLGFIAVQDNVEGWRRFDKQSYDRSQFRDSLVV